jgi:hypothetical protein
MGESHKLKEMRPFLAIILADPEMLCTLYLVDFSNRNPSGTLAGEFSEPADLSQQSRSTVTSVTPHVGHFQTKNPLVLSLNVTGVSLTR